MLTAVLRLPLLLLIVVACGCGDPLSGPSPVPPEPPKSPVPFPPQPPKSPDGWTYLGAYSVTITAAPSCALPDSAMTRTQTGALLRQSGQNLEFLFDPFGPFEGVPGFVGTTDGDTMHLTLNGGYGVSGYSFVNWVNDTVSVGYTGAATGTMGERGLATSFDGIVLLYHRSDHAVFASCDARDHRIELVGSKWPQ
jgi:hypothetical protein